MKRDAALSNMHTNKHKDARVLLDARCSSLALRYGAPQPCEAVPDLTPAACLPEFFPLDIHGMWYTIFLTIISPLGGRFPGDAGRSIMNVPS